MLIYYDTNHARHYEPGKVYQHEDVYSRQPFMITMEDRLGNTSLWEKMQAEEIHYVHELQHWLMNTWVLPGFVSTNSLASETPLKYNNKSTLKNLPRYFYCNVGDFC